MSTIANTNVISFPKPSLSAIHEAIANWEGRSGLNYPDCYSFLVAMASALARKWKSIDKDATPESREEAKQAIIKALSRRAKEFNVAGSGADIFESALVSPTNNDGDSQTLNSARASSFEMKKIQWLWPDRFALGKLGLVVGLPDEGKGQVFCDMAARVTRGSEWPCGEGRAPKGNVILLTAEDDISDTIVPRMRSADADLDRIEIVKMVRQDDNRDRMFSLVTDLPLLRQKIAEVGDVKLVQIDPITAYLGNSNGKMDSYRTTDVRAVLGPVVEFAADLNVAVVGIMHFNKKTDVDNALLRISDSLAFGATARHVYAVVDDAENDRKLFVKAKNNLAAAGNKSLAYHFGGREVGFDPETGEAIFAPHILWEKDHVDVTASEAMQANANKSSPSARDEAKKFLTDILASGPMLQSEIQDAAEGNGIAKRTLERAKRELGIKAEKDGTAGRWAWRLPDTVH